MIWNCKLYELCDSEKPLNLMNKIITLPSQDKLRVYNGRVQVYVKFHNEYKRLWISEDVFTQRLKGVDMNFALFISLYSNTMMLHVCILL